MPQVGALKARQLARQYGLPLVAVHHMEAHALVARLPAAASASAPAPVSTTPTASEAEAASASGSSSSGASWHATATDPHADTASSASIAAPAAAVADLAAVQQAVDAAAAVPFPFLCLLVSGGHNLLVLVRGVGQYVQLGTTVDDALGERAGGTDGHAAAAAAAAAAAGWWFKGSRFLLFACLTAHMIAPAGSAQAWA